MMCDGAPVSGAPSTTMAGTPGATAISVSGANARTASTPAEATGGSRCSKRTGNASSSARSSRLRAAAAEGGVTAITAWPDTSAGRPNALLVNRRHLEIAVIAQLVIPPASPLDRTAFLARLHMRHILANDSVSRHEDGREGVGETSNAF